MYSFIYFRPEINTGSVKARSRSMEGDVIPRIHLRTSNKSAFVHLLSVQCGIDPHNMAAEFKHLLDSLNVAERRKGEVVSMAGFNPQCLNG